MTKLKALNPKFFRKKMDSSQLDFKNTNEIKTLSRFIGQDRALQALSFGIDVKGHGYNIYAMGPSGLGKRSLIKIILAEHSRKSLIPPDWCYLHNFATPEKPVALQLPHGRGNIFQRDMQTAVDEIGSHILTMFESDEYRASMKKISNFYDRKRKQLSNIKNSIIDKTPGIYKEQHKKETQLKNKVVTATVKPIINKLKKKYEKFKIVSQYLSEMQHDIIQHIDDFLKLDEKTNLMSYSSDNPVLVKYKVNVLVDNSNLQGYPIIFDDSPHYSSLICRVEYTNLQGFSTTNFSLIKAGSLHKANGGFLIIEARKLKKIPEAWEALKNALYSQKITIEPVEHDSSSVNPVSLEPMPIPLDVKVILIGDRTLYYSLCDKDPDFTELFKVPVDFDEQIPRSQKNILLYARLIATIAKHNKLLPFDAEAVAYIIDYSSRLVDDIEKLSTHIRSIEDVILESDYWAKKSNKHVVKSSDVRHALQAQAHRMDRAREGYYEDIKRNFIIINTSGKSVGQVNCLSVRRVGDFSYGHPTRVTARVRKGKGTIIDIQREIKLAGPLHSKASLTISHFLASRFNVDEPFALSASLAFEQIYCWTEGDSASVGELCALLSALSNIPIFQHLAVTGSIDQYGEVQAIGGVNEKIEGFFDVCLSRGLNGKQGVLIPAVNVSNLMLREDIVAAAKAGKFFIYPINTIDDAVTLLTGCEAGKRAKQGLFSEGSVYHDVEARLKSFSQKTSKK